VIILPLVKKDPHHQQISFASPEWPAGTPRDSYPVPPLTLARPLRMGEGRGEVAFHAPFRSCPVPTQRTCRLPGILSSLSQKRIPITGGDPFFVPAGDLFPTAQSPVPTLDLSDIRWQTLPPF